MWIISVKKGGRFGCNRIGGLQGSADPPTEQVLGRKGLREKADFQKKGLWC